MQRNALLGLQFISAALFVFLLFVGVWIWKHHQRLFGADPDIPSESPGARDYNRLQVVALWLHALLLTGSFALLLH
jgi:hypothetical protein